MTAKEIRKALFAKDHTYTSVARALGVSRAAVQQVAYRKAKSKRIIIKIAEILGKPPAIVFPELAHRFNSPDITQNRTL